MVQRLARLASGVPGLDPILGGGFIEGASYIIQGSPGAGKTILSNQIAFAQASDGRRILYVTLLAETHDRLFQALATMAFFDHAMLGDAISYVSVFQTLRDDGLSAVVKLIREETQRQGATLLVFDGLLNARDRAETDLDVKTFVAEIQSQAAFVNCTVLFLTSTRIPDSSPEHTMVDGVIDLSDEVTGVRAYRRLQVRKSRASAALSGLHQFEISNDGVTVFPRLESIAAHPSVADHPNTGKIASGVGGLDARIGGGLPAASVTMLMGPPGSGKTSIGLSFLNQCRAPETALFCGFYEAPSRLIQKGNALGLDTAKQIEAGLLTVLWNPLTENILDKVAGQVLDKVRQHKVRRVVLDGIGGFERATPHHERLVEFFCALTNELRALDVTTVITAELRELSEKTGKTPLPDISAMLDNLFILRQEIVQSTPGRTMSILKIRDSDFDRVKHSFVISDAGISLAGGPATPEPGELADREKG